MPGDDRTQWGCWTLRIFPVSARDINAYFSSSWSPPHLRLRSWIFDPNKLRIKLQNEARIRDLSLFNLAMA
jgi:hypothetical protein